MNIPVSKPYLNKQGRKYLTDAYDSGWISSKSPYVEKFEEKFASIHGMKYGAATSSGTTALTLAIRALGLKKGDAVIVPEFTMVASAWSCTYNGVTIVPIDCGDDLLIRPDYIEKALRINPNIKAIMAVHIYGRRCNMDAIMKLAYEYNVKVIEDSAEAHGIPPVGDIACFSMYANKINTSGEGGICISNDKKLIDQVKYLRGMAFDANHTFLHKTIGFNFRMPGLQAAVALSQAEMLDEILKKRKQIEQWYNEGLKDIDEVELMPKRNVLWMYDIKVQQPLREPLMAFLAENGISTRRFFRPMSEQPMYYNEKYFMLRASELAGEGLYLPTFTQLTKKEVDYICGKIRVFFNKFNLEI